MMIPQTLVGIVTIDLREVHESSTFGDSSRIVFHHVLFCFTRLEDELALAYYGFIIVIGVL